MSFLTKVGLGLLVAFFAVTAKANHTAEHTTAPAAQQSVGQVILTSDNTLILNDVIMDDTGSNLARKAKDMDSKLPSGEPIYLVLNTPGGSIEAGIDMINVIKNLNRKVHTVSIFAASMGFQTVQGLSARLVLPTGTLMSHKAKGGFYGEFPGQLDSRYGFYLKRVQNLDRIAVGRTKGKHTLKSYASLIENEYWCEGQDCVNEGFADRVVNAKCDASLNGTRNEVLKFFFFGMRIELTLVYANCPLITGVLDYDISVDGQKLFKNRDKNASTYYESDVTITKEEIKALDAKVQEIIKDRTARKVIKGY